MIVQTQPKTVSQFLLIKQAAYLIDAEMDLLKLIKKD